jgi:hypothetical protein
VGVGVGGFGTDFQNFCQTILLEALNVYLLAHSEMTERS